ncbi:MAG: glyoxalase/bleomycin resistance/dioxygenase family protein [Tannerella sp.]|jgi:catechol 2,3-dioxygenase-like lactoylglutathione lyase family enzyme|nr:glyoxalase/bleomycin resistance/dioxygenase family protein [Tannerella sp.]
MDLRNCTPVLFVKNAQTARQFYESLLEMKVKADFGGLNIVFEEGFAVWQIMNENIIPQTLGSDNITNRDLTSRFEMCFETEDLDNVYKTLKDNNIKFLHEVNVELWGQRTIRFYDPDGHLVEVGEAMHVFIRRIYKEENYDIEATAKRAYTPVDILKQILQVQ